MRSSLLKTYFYFVTLPDRLYPFAVEVKGRRFRGRKAYDLVARRAFRKYGLGRFGYKLMFYRETFHFIGSILFITFATLVSQDLFGSDTALYVLLGAAIIALSYQEFYAHPKHYGQHARKGITDWLTWVAPMIAYLYLFK